MTRRRLLKTSTQAAALAQLSKIAEKDETLHGSIKVTSDRCFAGLEAYRQVIDSEIDYVLLCTPPGFRPEHIEYAVKRGVHIFAEKPCATDAPGVRRILALEDEMKRKGTDAKIGEEILGTKGCGSLVERKVELTGPNARIFREHPDQHESHHQEHIDFIAALRRGETPNDTRFLCESTLTAIMGRESAYTGKYVTWDEILNSELRLVPPDIAAWDGSIRPVPKPGLPRV